MHSRCAVAELSGTPEPRLLAASLHDERRQQRADHARHTSADERDALLAPDEGPVAGRHGHDDHRGLGGVRLASGRAVLRAGVLEE